MSSLLSADDAFNRYGSYQQSVRAQFPPGRRAATPIGAKTSSGFPLPEIEWWSPDAPNRWLIEAFNAA